MGRKKNVTKKPGKYWFWLSGSNRLYFKSQTLIDFTPLPAKEGSNKSKRQIKSRYTWPVFNLDGKYYTPGFKVPISKVDSDKELKFQHEKKVAEYENGMEDIFVPKPRSKHKYCGVCKQYYQQYLEHIQSVQHKNKIKNSQFQKQINRLCSKFEIQSSDKIIEEQEPEVIDLSSQSCEVQSTRVENQLAKNESFSEPIVKQIKENYNQFFNHGPMYRLPRRRKRTILQTTNILPQTRKKIRVIQLN